MRTLDVLRATQAAGIGIELDGGDLVLQASQPPPPSLLDALSRNKGAILVLLTPRDGWTAADWRMFYDERAGIGEYDGGLPRVEAEALAFDECLKEWLRHSPTEGNVPRKPAETDVFRLAEERQEDGIAALMAMGLPAPDRLLDQLEKCRTAPEVPQNSTEGIFPRLSDRNDAAEVPPE